MGGDGGGAACSGVTLEEGEREGKVHTGEARGGGEVHTREAKGAEGRYAQGEGTGRYRDTREVEEQER